MTFLLVHGGLWGDEDAEFFWHRPGVTKGLEQHGIEVIAPDRLGRPGSWDLEAAWLADRVTEKAVVVGGSYGCSAAVRFALGWPERVERLVLAWPATADDPEVASFTRAALTELGASAEATAALLAGETLPGATDAELRGLGMPVAVVPARPENAVHPRRTVDAVKELTGAVELVGCPEPPRPGFQAGAFVDSVVQFGLRRW